MSVTEKLTLTRALSTIKSLDNQIETYFTEQRYLVSIYQGDAKRSTIAGMNYDELKTRIQSDTDKLDNLIKKRTTLKNALVLANARLTVEIAGTVYTIAEALELKKLIPIKEKILKAYRQQLDAVQKALNKNDEELNARIEGLIRAQTTENTTKEALDEVTKSVTESQNAALRIHILDPKKIVQRIEALSNEIREIRTELDHRLSVINATETIEITVDA